jgi:hypothetical protein
VQVQRTNPLGQLRLYAHTLATADTANLSDREAESGLICAPCGYVLSFPLRLSMSVLLFVSVRCTALKSHTVRRCDYAPSLIPRPSPSADIVSGYGYEGMQMWSKERRAVQQGASPAKTVHGEQRRRIDITTSIRLQPR